MTAVVADTFTVLKPILLFIKCFGLAPYTVVGKMGSRHLKTSILDVLFSVILIGVSIFLVFYQTSLWRVIEGVSICSVTEKVIVFSTIIQFVLSAFVCLLKRHRIVEIANQLAGLNAVIKRSCGCVWRRMCVTLMSHLLISVLSVATCFVSDMFSRFHSAISVSLVTFNVLTFACFLTEFQIVGFFMLLKQLISDLNSSIRGIGEIKGNQDEECPCFKKLPLNRTAPIFVTSSYEKFRSKATTEDFPDKKVILLRDVQDSLCAASESLNSAYSFLLLYTSAKTFICLTHSLYFILLSVFMSDSSSCGKGWQYSYYVWFIHYALKLVWLVFYSSSAIQQSNHTAVLVHKLITKTRDAGLREELRVFSLQLLHRKVKFTACGFFPLDFTLLYSIVGAVTTYLVILIQFQLSLVKSDHSKTSIVPPHWIGTTTPTVFVTTVLP